MTYTDSNVSPSWDKVFLDGDVTTRNFGPEFADNRQEPLGHKNYQFEFRNPLADDFSTEPKLPKAVNFKLENTIDWPGSYDWEAKTCAPSHVAGAVQADGSLFEGPPFQRDVEHCEDDLHIVAAIREASAIRIVFDAFLSSGGEPPEIRLTAAGLDTVCVVGTVDRHTLTIPPPCKAKLRELWEHEELLTVAHVVLPSSLTSATERPVSVWAAPDRRVSIYDDVCH